MGCIFCDIIDSAVESSQVFSNEHALAFMDISQITPGHVLVVSRRHAETITDLSSDEAAETFRVVHLISQAVRSSDLRCDGMNIWQSNGAAAMQEVPHVHFHIIPRFPGDPLELRIRRNRPTFARPELDAFAAKIRDQLP